MLNGLINPHGFGLITSNQDLIQHGLIHQGLIQQGLFKQGVIKQGLIHKEFFCLFDLILCVPSTIFQLNRDGSSWVEPVLS